MVSPHLLSDINTAVLRLTFCAAGTFDATGVVDGDVTELYLDDAGA
jgi:hypothetical protein